jgi:hypothetical protein
VRGIPEGASLNDAAPTAVRIQHGDEIMKLRSKVFAFTLAVTLTLLAAAGMPYGPIGLVAAARAPQAAGTAKITFRGVEYFLRASQGKGYEFRPSGQDDPATFTDSLTLDLYPAAHDEEALATITSRIRAIAENAKGTILPATVSASGKSTSEHFFAAVVPTAHGADFDAIRVVLVDKQAVGVFYTHRSYGQSAVDATSEWAKKNAAEVEKQLLQFDTAHAVSSAKGSASPSPAADEAGLPAGTIKKGTLTSPQLMRDTMQGVVGKVGTLGCDKIEDVTRYVVTPFSGAPRSRQWREKWMVKGCGKQYPVDIDFKEDGAGGADWAIRN